MRTGGRERRRHFTKSAQRQGAIMKLPRISKQEFERILHYLLSERRLDVDDAMG